jgi:hypothetical protein
MKKDKQKREQNMFSFISENRQKHRHERHGSGLASRDNSLSMTMGMTIP